MLLEAGAPRGGAAGIEHVGILLRRKAFRDTLAHPYEARNCMLSSSVCCTFEDHLHFNTELRKIN